MDEFKSSTTKRNQEQRNSSGLSSMKKSCLSFSASFQECLAYCKAFFVGQGKKLMARNEKEATAAELQTAKMQVEATDAAERKKSRLHQSA